MTATLSKHLKEEGPCPTVLFGLRRSLREISQKQLRHINHGNGNGNDGERELTLIYIYPSTVKGISLEMNIANNYSHHLLSVAVRKKSS